MPALEVTPFIREENDAERTTRYAKASDPRQPILVSESLQLQQLLLNEMRTLNATLTVLAERLAQSP